MNRSKIHISFCGAFSALLLLSFADQARAACDPPRDISSCLVVPKELFAQARPALPEPPFVVAYPGMRNALVLTYSDLGPNAPNRAAANSNCNPQNMSGCASVSSADLTNSAVARKNKPFRVLFEDGRSLVAHPVPKQ